MPIPAHALLMAAAGAAATIPSSDDFNRAASSDLGPNWVEVDGSWAIVSNDLRMDTGSDSHVRWAYDLGSTDQFAEVDVLNDATTARSTAIILRYNDTGTETYYMGRYYFGTGAWEIYKRAAGTFTLLASDTNNDPTVPYRIRFEVEGTALRLYQVVTGTPVLRVSTTNGDISTGNYAGMRCAQSSASPTMDNWSVGTL
jgi:hypothetical protein